MFKKIEDFAKEKMKGEKVTGIDHTMRVWKGCQILAQGKDIDMDVLHSAALLHDISCPLKGRKNHHEDSARMAEVFLREIKFPEEKIPSVLHCIRAHSRYGGPEPQTPEAEILYDSDVLDFIGAIGLVRGVTRGFEWGYTGDVFEAPNIFTRMKSMVIKRPLYTEKAREIALNRYNFVDLFVARLREELNYEK
jgi:uncharacterized protein